MCLLSPPKLFSAVFILLTPVVTCAWPSRDPVAASRPSHSTATILTQRLSNLSDASLRDTPSCRVRIAMASQDKSMPFIKNLASSGECLRNVHAVRRAIPVAVAVAVAFALANPHR